jgi:general secretion pathway protein K
MDWRDADDLLHMHGAEDNDYRSAGLPWTSRDASFERIEELQYVFGMTRDIYQAVVPYVTVHAGHRALDIDAAPQFLINALSAAAAPLNGTAARDARGPGNYHIAVAVQGADSTLVSIEAVVNISGSGDAPYRLLEWREPARLVPATDEEPAA